MMEHPLDLQAIEDEIRRCISLCKSQGIALQAGEMGATRERLRHHSTPDRVCLLGAVAWVHQHRAAGQNGYELARMVLGLTEAEGVQLCRGFDGIALSRSTGISRMGQRLRQEYLACRAEDFSPRDAIEGT
jgi:hypothetical protein